MRDILKDLEWRYAVKKFNSSSTVEDEKVDKLKKAFNLTATSYGLQPLKLVVLANKSVQKKLVALSYGQEQVVQASHVLVFCIEKKIDDQYIKSYFHKVKEIRGTDDAVLEPYQEALIKEFSKKDSADINSWATKQAYLAMGNLLTVCALEHIDACPMEGFNSEGYNKLLKLDERGLNAVLVMPVGYRAEDDIFSGFKKVRRNLEDTIIEWN